VFLVSRRIRIIPVAIRVLYRSVSLVNHQLGILILGYFSAPLNSVFLPVKMLRCSVRTALFDVPTVIRCWNDVMGFSWQRDISYSCVRTLEVCRTTSRAKHYKEAQEVALFDDGLGRGGGDGI
jgi:hypothetical protein